MKLVIFDCDGVLVNTEELFQESHREVFAEFGLAFTLRDVHELFTGLSYDAYLEKRNAVYQEAFGMDLPPEFGDRLMQVYTEKEDSRMGAVDGIFDLLDSLKKAEIPFCVASNSGIEGLDKKLKKAGLHHFIHPHIFSREHVTRGKPAPDVYLHAAERMGVHPSECIVVEDSVIGARAGIAAGMYVIGFDRQDQPLAGDGTALLAAGVAEAVLDGITLKQRIFCLLGFPPPQNMPSYRPGPSPAP